MAPQLGTDFEAGGDLGQPVLPQAPRRKQVVAVSTEWYERGVMVVAVTPDVAAEQARVALADGVRHLAVVGRPGSGRSLTLDLLADLLEPSPPPVRLTLTRSDDAAFVGLVELARQTGDDSLLELVCSPKERWATKLAETVGVLGARPRTILFEDPRFEAEVDPDIFTLRAWELTTAIHDLASSRVVYAAGPWDPVGSKIHVRPGSSPQVVLDSNRWGSDRLQAAARTLLSAGSPRLERYSPLELRLAVACVAAGTQAKDLLERPWSADELVARSLAGTNAERLRAFVGTLAYCRVPFSLDAVEVLLGAALPTEEALFLQECLLLRTKEGLFLVHELVANHAQRWVDNRRDAHAKLATWHREEFQRKSADSDLGHAARHELEVVHHLTEAGDAVGILNASVYFSEQYDALGKALSIAKRYEDAISAYERALAHDDDDAYAHHYLAYNLDVPGIDAPRVLTEYRRARDLRPDHVWHHSRLITALVTVGRLSEAEECWALALQNLPAGKNTFDGLHRNVLKLLLHRGELDFAKRVLDSVPPAQRRDLEWYGPLEERLTLLEEAAHDHNVFPPVVRIPERWSGPHLLRNRDDREKITGWLPGRITRADDDGGLRLLLCRHEHGVDRYFYRELDAATVANMSPHVKQGFSLPEGTFVEVLTYAGAEEQLLTWPRHAGDLASLSIDPPPDRYIRRAFTRA